ncbi:hypothetical protein J7T55_010214 [Diaporthe amygdali]|uniref:uncharacterized protein n=1 Tax=Phomopsis amygdali TaxID=1214568 RepID=UPI0022FE397C|nr:uncharacterized protein J7T55_010214 [Diaporthe amygdali]KAJ0113970.1 hypothetical protein J7T55_010214 [Diaporthe amygdali]
MGIRGLTASLRPFAARSELAGRIVIDGPALAYHILFACRLESRVSTVLKDPSYFALGSKAIQWLDDLQSAIYFDGYLPASKSVVRLDRVVETSTASNKYFLSTSSGIALDGDSEPAIRQANPRMPIPAFIVPAILDALRTSGRYSHLTHLVPGEADCFCAEHVGREGGTLLTSDSDLLLYDLGQDGRVVFFNDIEINNEEAAQLAALTYSQHAICEKLSLESGQQGMLSLAFEIMMDPYRKVPSCVAQSKKNHSANAFPVDYANFISEYVKGPESILAIPKYLKILDPRVSEFVLSWTRDAEGGNSALDNAPRDGLIFYLPLLLDRWDRESAWSPSMWIRQLAYSLCGDTQGTKSMVSEYRRTMSRKSNGQAVELLNDHDVAQTARGLVSSFSSLIDTAAIPSSLGWATFCLQQEITHASEHGKESLALKLWQKASKSRGRLDPGSWDTVHLAAQIQGTLYSLRILHQVLRCQIGPLVTSAGLQPQVAKLVDCLSTLPSFADFLSTTDVAGLFVRLQEAGVLDVLAEITGQQAHISFEKTGSRSRRKKRQADRLEQRKARPPPSANPFDALS